MMSSNQRRFRFSLRTMFMAVMLFSVVLGWLGMQLKWMHYRREALRWIAGIRARQIAAQSGTPIPARKGYYVSHSEIKAPWSIRFLGAPGVEQLEVNQEYLGPEARYSLAELQSLFPEAEVGAFDAADPRPAGAEWLIRGNGRGAAGPEPGDSL